MLKKISYYFCILLLLAGCLEPESTDSKNDESLEVGDPLINKPILDKNNLGSIFFFGNSHTWNTPNLETMLKENGYEAKIYHIHTGGNVPLGNDYYINKDKSRVENACNIYGCDESYYTNQIFNRNHLSNLLEQEKDISGNELNTKFFPDDLSWIIIHDGSVYSSLTSAGAFMGLASSFGAKTACYQSWDLFVKDESIYASKKFHLPMIPVGGAIRSPEDQLKPVQVNGSPNYISEYQLDDGHMNNMGKYMYCVLFTHFFTGLPIDEIMGNGDLPTKAPEDKKGRDQTYLTEENKTEMKERMKRIIAETDEIFKDIRPYYECVKGFDDFSKFSDRKTMKEAKEYIVPLQLSQPVIFSLPKGENNKKIKVEVKSNNSSIIPDIWLYDTEKKQLTAQSANTGYLQNYTFTGKGESWETDGSKVLIVTRRGKTNQGGELNERNNYEVPLGTDGLDATIEESVDQAVDFTIKVSFVD